VGKKMERKTSSAKNTELQWTFRNLPLGVVLTRGIETALHGDPTASKRTGEEDFNWDQRHAAQEEQERQKSHHERSGFIRVHPPAPPFDRAAALPARTRRILQTVSAKFCPEAIRDWSCSVLGVIPKHLPHNAH
jgi:hypothetical protein